MTQSGGAGNGSPFRIMKSLDSGKTFKTVIEETKLSLGGLHFRNATEGFFAHQTKSQVADLYFTSDGLATTVIRDDSLPIGGDPSAITALVPVDDGSWLICCGGNLYRTSDLGQHWKLITINNAVSTDILGASRNLALATTQFFSVSQLDMSVDYGVTWSGSTMLADTGIVETITMPSRNRSYVLLRTEKDAHRELQRWDNPQHLTIGNPSVLPSELRVVYGVDGTLHLRVPNNTGAQRLAIFDMLGRNRGEQLIQAGVGEIHLCTTGIPEGAYLASLNGAKVKFMVFGR